jgi:hypothetical protein
VLFGHAVVAFANRHGDLIVPIVHDAGRFHHSNLPRAHAPVIYELCSNAAQDGHTQFFLEDGCPLCFLPHALSMPASNRSCAHTSFAEAPLAEILEKHGCVRHEPGGLLERVALIGLLPVLALVGHNSLHLRLTEQRLDLWLLPRCGSGRVLVQKVCTMINLLLVQLAAPTEVHSGFLKLSADHGWVALGFVQVLNVRERRAHGRTYQKHGSLLIEASLSFFSHCGDIEIPWAAFLVASGQVQSEPRQDAQSGSALGCFRDSRG